MAEKPKKKPEPVKPIELTEEQHNAVCDWWEKYHDAGELPKNEYERARFQVFDSAVNALGILEEEGEKDPDFAKSSAYAELDRELLANRDTAAIICAEFLNLI
jgi:hypothetical protein